MAATNDQRRAAQPTPRREEFNAADERQVAERTSQAKLRDHVYAQGLAHTLSTMEGRAWVYKVLDACGVFRTSFTGNSETFMREGQRNVGLLIMADIMRDQEEAYLLMCREARERGMRTFRPKVLKNDDDGDTNG